MHLDNVEDFYPLAPAQQGILFHAQATETPTYISQLAFTFDAGFDERKFENAWRVLLERHAVLRSFFVWEGLTEPVQVVRRQVGLPIERHDWRHIKDIEGHLHRFLDEDRKRGFDLRTAPAMRLILIRLPEDRYRFIWSHHHIALDGWSVPLLLGEFFALYGSESDPSQVKLAARRPYRDYITWLAGQDVAKAKEYWSSVLGGFDSPISIGDYAPRAEDRSAQGWEHEICVGEGFAECLRQFGRKHHLTVNTIVLGAWAILLSRYTDQSDIVFGTTVSGRPPDLPDAQDMVGLFINTLPVRVQLNDRDTVVEMLQRIQQQQARTRQFEYSRLVDVQQWSDVRRGASLFDTIVVVENYPANALGDAVPRSITLSDWTFHAQTNYALTLVAALNGDAFTLRCVHDPDRVTPGNAVRILDHLLGIIRSILSGSVATGAIEALTTAERQRSVQLWSDATGQPLSNGATIPERFAAQVRAHPEGIALVGDHEALTYRELDLRSNRLARYLRAQGIGPEKIVALFLERGTPVIVAMLAVLKAGAAYLPLDVTSPRSRNDGIVKDSGAALILTTRALSHQLGEAACPVIELDGAHESIAAQSSKPVDLNVCGRNLAYLIYTSGSTGRPKGVMVEHRSVVNLVDAQVRKFNITTASRTLQFASLSFDASVWEIFCALLSGSVLHVTATADLRDADELTRILRAREISMVTLPPMLLAVMGSSGFPHLSTLVAAGDACDPAVSAKWGPGRRFFNAYGPTETTVCASVSESLDGTQPVDIGTPFANARIYILDSGLRPVPPGVTGEMYVGGAVLSRGYARDPAQTGERYLPDPFADVPGCRMYRTGDRARHLPSGAIEYVGRVDFQVKLRGFRVELGEIQTLLESEPLVAQACVVTREAGAGQKQLVAYVVPRGGAALQPADLSAMLRGQLPEYAVPSAVVVLDAMPLNASGKIDRAALPEPEKSSGLREQMVAPRNDIEARIAAIWCEVLRLDAVDMHDNFFELGGHSFLLMQVHSELKTAFSKDISLTQMFGLPTVAMLAGYFSATTPAPTNAFAAIHARASRSRQALNLAEDPT